MAQGLSCAAIVLACLSVILFWLMGEAEPGSVGLAISLWMLAGLCAPLVALAGLLLAKRGGKRAPRLARVAFAFGIGASAWPLLMIVAFTGSY